MSSLDFCPERLFSLERLLFLDVCGIVSIEAVPLSVSDVCEKEFVPLGVVARLLLSFPEYIVWTAFVLKELSDEKGKSRLIMRLRTSADPDDYKNSIITFQKTREKEWNRIIRNKKILYKKE